MSGISEFTKRYDRSVQFWAAVAGILALLTTWITLAFSGSARNQRTSSIERTTTPNATSTATVAATMPGPDSAQGPTVPRIAVPSVPPATACDPAQPTRKILEEAFSHHQSGRINRALDRYRCAESRLLPSVKTSARGVAIRQALQLADDDPHELARHAAHVRDLFVELDREVKQPQEDL